MLLLSPVKSEPFTSMSTELIETSVEVSSVMLREKSKFIRLLTSGHGEGIRQKPLVSEQKFYPKFIESLNSWFRLEAKAAKSV